MEEEVLETLIKRAVDACFEDDNSKFIASSAIRKTENQKTSVKSLEFLALKATVAERRKVDDIQNVLFRLIFKEPLNVDDYGYSCSNLFFCWQSRLDCRKLRNDPYVMYAIVQKYAMEPNCTIGLILTRTHLTIKYSYFTIATIPNRENERFDTFWATRFLQLCLKMRCRYVELGLQEDEELWDEDDDDYTGSRSILNSVIDSVNRVTPAEGWKEAIAKGDLAIYERYDDHDDDNAVLTNLFLVKKFFKMSPPDVCHYCAFQV